MRIVTKRNGKILMMLGMLLIITSFLGSSIVYSMFGGGEYEEYSEWVIALPAEGKVLHLTFTLFFVPIGPMLAVIGIPMFIVSSKRKRVPSLLMAILKSSVDMRIKISFLAQQLGINEKDVINTISRLRSNGESVSVDYSTSEAIYNPTLLPSRTKVEKPSIPPTKVEKPSMTLYEKLSVVLTILTIVISIIVTLLVRTRI